MYRIYDFRNSVSRLIVTRQSWWLSSTTTSSKIMQNAVFRFAHSTVLHCLWYSQVQPSVILKLLLCLLFEIYLNFSLSLTRWISAECSAVYNDIWAKENSAEYTLFVLHNCFSQPLSGSWLGCSIHPLSEAGYVCSRSVYMFYMYKCSENRPLFNWMITPHFFSWLVCLSICELSFGHEYRSTVCTVQIGNSQYILRQLGIIIWDFLILYQSVYHNIQEYILLYYTF